MPTKRGSKASKQTAIGFYPTLNKPATAVGKYISAPGKFWNGCPAADKEKRFKCAVVEFSALHDYGDGVKGAGFSCKEMGEDGRGSLEPGVASGSEFMIGYPNPFLEYYYYENRSELPAAVRTKLFPDEVDPAATVGDAADASGDGAVGGADAAGGAVVKVTHEEERPPIFAYLTEVSRTLNSMGAARGKYTIKYKCCVQTPKGACDSSNTLYATGDGKAETTSNAWAHLREKAKKCPNHAAVLAKLEPTNSKVVRLADGDYVPVMNFAEAFPHHVDYVWCRARGFISATIGSKPLFRAYIRNYEPRAVFPHPEVQYNIALCIHELQSEEQHTRLTALQKEFKYGPCIGIVNGIAKEKKKPPQLYAVSEVLDFDVFPNTEHTGKAISEWFGGVLQKKDIRISSISGVTPDGAADGQLGLRLVEGLADKVDTCNLHGLQRSVLYSIGLAGSSSGNSEFKATLKAHGRIVQLSNQSRYGIRHRYGTRHHDP